MLLYKKIYLGFYGDKMRQKKVFNALDMQMYHKQC